MIDSKQVRVGMWIMLCGGVLTLAVSGCSQARAQETHTDSLGGVRKSISLTVFNEDFVQIGEERPWALKSGRNDIHLSDISKVMDPSSILYKWDTPEIQVVSSIYDLGVGNTETLLNRYIGEKVDMVWFNDSGQPGHKESGTLEMAAQGEIVLRTPDKVYVNPKGTLIVPPKDGLATVPQLTLGVESGKAGNSTLGVTYLSRGMSWKADYVARLDPEKDEMGLESWASITNTTGIDYPLAKVTLVAGSPNRLAVAEAQGVAPADSSPAYFISSKAKSSDREVTYNRFSAPTDLGELQAYPIKAETTIRQNQINRARMFFSQGVKIERDYSIDLNEYQYNWAENAGQPKRQSAQLAIRFKNDKDSGLGISLPQGGVRFYEPDSASVERYIGAAMLQNTPEKTGAFLTLTNVFNVSVEPNVSQQKRLDKHRVLREMAVKISNRKKATVTLRVVNRFGSSFKITEESLKSQNLDSRTAQWKVPVPAGADVVLKFTAVLTN